MTVRYSLDDERDPPQELAKSHGLRHVRGRYRLKGLESPMTVYQLS